MRAIRRPLSLALLILWSATAAHAADGLRAPDAAAVWPQWQLRLSRPQDPVSVWRHEAWWGSSRTASLRPSAATAPVRLSPKADTSTTAVAQSGL